MNLDVIVIFNMIGIILVVWNDFVKGFELIKV